MILLEAENLLIKELLSKQFAKLGPMDQTLTDFDGVRYHIESTKTGPLTLSMAINCWTDLAQCGCLDILKREYGPYIKDQTNVGYNITLEFDQANIPTDEGASRVEVVRILSLTSLIAPITSVASCSYPFAFATEAQCDGRAFRTCIRFAGTDGKGSRSSSGAAARAAQVTTDDHPLPRRRGLLRYPKRGPGHRRILDRLPR